MLTNARWPTPTLGEGRDTPTERALALPALGEGLTTPTECLTAGLRPSELGHAYQRTLANAYAGRGSRHPDRESAGSACAGRGSYDPDRVPDRRSPAFRAGPCLPTHAGQRLRWARVATPRPRERWLCLRWARVLRPRPSA